MVKCGHIDKLLDNDIFKQAHYTTQCRWLTNCRQWAVLMADGTKKQTQSAKLGTFKGNFQLGDTFGQQTASLDSFNGTF